MKRYHKKIYFPHVKKLKEFNASLNSQTWQYSNHALDRINQQIDFREIRNLLTDINVQELNETNIFEYYVDNENIDRVCYRVSYSNLRDIILVIGRCKKLITVYLNDVNDNHMTLNESLYIKEVLK